jgi:hypothetical protein
VTKARRAWPGRAFPVDGMFEEALEELVRRTGALFAIFCDYEGESIALASGDGRDPYDIRVAGAEMGAHVLHLQRRARARGESERLFLACEAAAMTLLVEGVAGGYYVLLAVPAGAPWSVARRSLCEVVGRFALET